MPTSIVANFSVGANGGSGNNGGAVTVANTLGASIATSGYNAHGIFAQSIGGGGGISGVATATSGKETQAGTAKKVVLTNLAKFAAGGVLEVIRLAYLFAQESIPDNINTLSEKVKPSVPKQFSLNVSLGGSGGSGGNGGAVTVTNAGSIDTEGNTSFGIFAQSVGGGGGAGGMANVATEKLAGFKLALGGSGGSGGTGGAVTVTNSGAVTTLSNSSFGIVGQSVGGGGGSGAAAIDGNSGQTLNAGLKLLLGGGSGTTGNGGAVAVTNSGQITTYGAQSHGIVAQSISGGGGINAVSLYDPRPWLQLDALLTAAGITPEQVGLKTPIDKARKALASEQQQSLSYNFSLGASGNTTGNAGNVTVANNGSIATSGLGAFGILAQSISGGGGLVSDGAGTVSSTALSGVLGAGGTSGNAGNVTIALGAGSSIQTSGNGAVGVFAQSIGGGGGYIGAQGATSGGYASVLQAKAAANGNGGAVTINASNGTQISTQGSGAHGIFAQSLGGGGGSIGMGGAVLIPTSVGTARPSAGKGGAISVDFNGSILANGANSDAIFAQSGVQGTGGLTMPGTSLGPVNIAVANGAIQGGSGSGVGIQIDGGIGDTITVGRGATVSALSGNAIASSWGGTTVIDSGVINGNIALQGSLNSLAVTPGGTLDADDSINLNNGVLTNQGRLGLGDGAPVSNTTLTGNLVNTGGTIGLGANFGTMQANTLSVSGSAKLTSGAVTVGLLGLPSTFDPANMPALSVIKAQSLTLAPAMTATPTVVLTYGLFNPNANTVGVKIQSANFMPASVSSLPDVTDDMKSVASALQTAWNEGNIDQDATDFVGLGNYTDPAGYAKALSASDDADAAVSASTMLYSGLQFQNTLHSCPVFVDETTVLNEQDCVYLRNIGSASTLSDGEGGSSFHSSGYAVELGGEKEFAPGWFVGGAIAPGQTWSKNSDSEIASNTLDVGLVAKHFITDRLLLAGSVSYGNDSATLSRGVEDNLYGELTSSAQEELNRVTGRVRAEYNIPFPSWYIRPMMDVDLTYTHMNPYTESGAGVLDVSYDATDNVVPDFSPTVEFGKRLDYKNLVARLYADIGMTWLVNPDWEQEGNFVDLPDADFNTYSALPALLGRLNLGAQLVAWRNLSVQAEYDGTYSPSYTNNTGTIRADWRF